MGQEWWLNWWWKGLRPAAAILRKRLTAAAAILPAPQVIALAGGVRVKHKPSFYHFKRCKTINYIVRKTFPIFLVLIGTVIGSGFLSGKEIVVFFTRFGSISFLCIPLAFLGFWGMFYFAMVMGQKALSRLQKSKISNAINIVMCIILSGAMFSGCYEILSFSGKVLSFAVMAVIILLCFHIIRHGLGFLERVNFVLVPIMVLAIVIFDVSMLCKGQFEPFSSKFSLASGLYAFAYVAFNTSNSGVLLAHLGKDLTKRQKARVSFFASLVLCLILLLSNIVLLENSESFNQEMPLLSLFEGPQRVVMQIVMLLGCVTTLYSLIFTLFNSLKGLVSNSKMCGFTTVALPLSLSLWGFGNIVSLLYPVSSVLALVLLFDLFFIPAFKQANKRVHNRGKNA